MKRISIILSLLICFSCTQDPETMIPFIEGYWEIQDVKKDGKLVKSYSISMTIDYFKVNADRSGFRKKVAPNLEGSFTITDHEIPFTLKVIDKALRIEYKNEAPSFYETIVEATDSMLVIKNNEGFKYRYKPFKKFDF